VQLGVRDKLQAQRVRLGAHWRLTLRYQTLGRSICTAGPAYEDWQKHRAA